MMKILNQGFKPKGQSKRDVIEYSALKKPKIIWKLKMNQMKLKTLVFCI